MRKILEIDQCDRDQLESVVRRVISEEIEKVKLFLAHDSSPPISNVDKLLTMKEAAKFLQITTATLLKNVKTGAISSKVVGKRRRFSQRDLQLFSSTEKNRKK
jgi:excisionase family DNA binding protein